MSTFIESRALTKDFGDLRAVDSVSFTVEAGEIFGLLGPNGAGKTTTLRMLSGLLAPTAGEAFINGHSMATDQMAARSELGFLTGDMDLYRRLNPVELLRYFGRLYQTPKAQMEERIATLVEAFGITPFADRHCEKLSTGQKQRVSIARTLVHDPQVVILDEPTTGLDIMASEFILQFIRRMAKEEGKAVIFSTHNLTEVERLCDRIAVIHEGQMAYCGDLPGIQQQTGQTTLPSAFFHLVNGGQVTA
ncbi:MAG: ABC transporter ATP-binding protein [Lewinella sp.]|nr:ABC transporter ATP-binding protein [Lewinella sp.]